VAPASAPVGIDAAQGASWAFFAIAVLFFVGCAGWCLRRWRRAADPVPALALLGGLIASLEESWIDSLIKLWYPRDAPLVAFTAYGTPQPLYLHLVYPGFVGLGAYVIYRGLLRDPSGRLLWLAFLGICLLDLLFELPATAAHVFVYYGHQPFQLFHHGWPLWVAPINAAGPALAGWLLAALMPRLTGRWRLLLALMPPAAYAGVYAATGWPEFTLLNSHVPGVLRWVAALVVVALCITVVALITRFIPARGEPVSSGASGGEPGGKRLDAGVLAAYEPIVDRARVDQLDVGQACQQLAERQPQR
jgi:hypothetical protein